MRKIPKLLILIFILALFLRLYKLDQFPLGFHVDEAKVAWESLSILKTARDDHGNLLALYYNSFGDYRPTGIFYVTIPSLIIFGRTNFAVRFSSAVFGALTIFPIYFLALTTTKKKSIAFTASLLLAIIPWGVTTSRATSEVVISCFLILSSLAFLSRKPLFSFLILITSFFFYHSARVMCPLLMLTWIIYLSQSGKLRLLSSNKIDVSKKIIFGFLATSFVSLILLLSPSGLSRYNQVKLSSPNLRDIVIQYTSYFDPNFLIGDMAKPFRYTTANVGIVSIPIFLCFLLGVFYIIKTNKDKILILLFVLGPIPAALTIEDSPNLHRAFFMLPFLVIIAAIGFNWLREKHKLITKIMIICILWSFVSFATNYLDINNNFAFQYRNPQTKRLALYLAQVKNNYTKIYVTNDPDSPYPWYGFFNNTDPITFNFDQGKNIDGKWNFENFVWDNTKCPAANAFDIAKKDPTPSKIMVVDNGECYTDFGKNHPEARIIKELDYNGHVNYRVWEYQPTR